MIDDKDFCHYSGLFSVASYEQKEIMTDSVTQFDSSQIMAMESRKRAQLINSLGGFKSVCLISTIDGTGSTNVAIFNSIFHIGANPPLIAFIVRPDSVDRHTLSNILETGMYTINHLNENIYKQAHQTSARYEKEISEFDATGLTREFKNGWKAPFVKESRIQMGVEFKQRIDIALNGTIMVIGEIKHISFPSDCLCVDGFVDIEKAKSITCSGLDSYHTTYRIGRLSYAKPDSTPSLVDLTYETN
ncbi:MAG: flavin reductase family protein [Flammeovirgaceae bacterium]|nr:flavin reductase family protein [Flammeovirgaceae bacterium]